MGKALNLDILDFVVVNVRTGNAIAAFMLPKQAMEYVAWLRSKEGPHGPMYDIVNADGTATVMDYTAKANE